MDKLEKALARLSTQERAWVREILVRLQSGEIKGLNIKKLRGRDDIFRVRKGDVRLIYQMREKEILLLVVDRENEKTYKRL